MTTGPDIESRALARTEAFAENMRHRARDGRDGEVVELTPDEHLLQRIEFLAKKVDKLAARLEAVEARPHITEDTVKQLNDGLNVKFQTLIEKLVNKALGDVRSRLVTVERTIEKVPAKAGSEPESAQLTRIGEIVHSLGKCVGTIQGDFDKRTDDLEQRYAEMFEHVTSINADVLRTKTMFHEALKAFQPKDQDAA